MTTLLASTLLLLGCGAAQAQEPPTFGTEVELVQIEVRVTEDGAPVGDLGPEDFVLEEDGLRQQIEGLEYVAPPAAKATLQVVREAGTPAEPAAPAEPPQPTWLYIAPEVRSPVEFTRVAGPLRRFIEDLPGGFRVSLAGLPFTDRKPLLLATLGRMVDEPLGRGSEQHSVVDPVLDLQDDLVFEREVLAALQQQDATSVPAAPIGLHRDPPAIPRADNMAGLVSVERVDRQLIFHGQLALLRYLDLIERMATLPGKKIVLLYRAGLRIEADHADLLEQLAAAALRHRVSVFTVDAGGLEAQAPVEDRRVRFAWDAGRPRTNTLGLPEARRQEANGLLTLARTTGGRSVVDSNDVGAILQDVIDESSGYYVLGYTPSDPRERGRFRKLEVSVSRPGIEVRAPRGFYERKPFERQSGKERSIALYRALLSASPRDFPVQTSVDFFAAPEGRTAMVFSVGVRPGLLAAKSGRRPELEATALLRVRNRILESMPLVLEQELRPDVDPGFLARAREDASVYLTYNGRIDLPPGRYAIKVLLRDDRSGRMGSFEGNVEAPRLSGPSVPSSLLLTRQGLRREEQDATTMDDTLTVGDLELTPEPAAIARQGQVVYCAYHLYNATAADFTAAERGMQMGLLRGEEWVGPEEASAGGQAFPDPENDVIRFLGWVDTEKLPPGRYTLLAVLPNYQTREVPDLTEEFELLAPRP